MLDRTWPLLCLALAACGVQVGEDAPAVAVGGSPLQAQVAAPPAAADRDHEPASPAPASAAHNAPAPVPAKTTVVLYSDLDAEVGSRMDGVVEAVLAELGDAVAAGQTLAVLDDEVQVARVTAARAALELTAREQSRMAELHSKGFVTAAQHEIAAYERQAAESALRAAEIELQHTRVTAPFAGVVTRRLTGLGRPVREAEPLFRITALQPLRALARLPEAGARHIRPGMRASLTTNDGGTVAARVARISPAVDPGSGTVEVLLDVPSPGPLRPGSSATLLLGTVEHQR